MNLIKSTGTFSFYTILSRILGYIRDFLIALNLGSGPVTDAFFVAFRIPNTFRRLFSEGTFNAAFVPSYSSELVKSKKKAEEFLNIVFSFLASGIIFSIDTFNKPSFNSAPLISTSSAIVNDLLKYLFEIPL